jgi:uncharacterized protein
MRVVIGGASGFLGTALGQQLTEGGHEVVRLVRHATQSPVESRWDPSLGFVDPAVIESADAVVNLSGSPIQQWPRSARVRDKILHSRVSATSTLAKAVAGMGHRPVFLSASGMSWYGTDRGDQELTEESTPGNGFLADVAQQWEDATQPAREAGSRVVWLRTSVVLDADDGALQLMKLPFMLGLGARLGSGAQWFSTISRRDWVSAVQFALENEVAGPINLACPTPATNAEFTKALAAQLHRPAFLAAPKFAVRTALGGLSDDLFGSLRVRPQALLDAGFTFRDRDVAETVASAWD